MAAKKFRKRVVRTLGELMMGSKRYSRPDWRKKEGEKITASRRRLIRAKARMEKTDKKIGERFKTIDKLHTKLKRKKRDR